MHSPCTCRNVQAFAGGVPVCVVLLLFVPVRVQAALARTMALWKTIYPGCMPQHAATPVPTSLELAQAGRAHAQPPNKRFNLRKNEGTEHAEQAAGIMKALIKSI